MTAVGLLETHKAQKLAELAEISGCLEPRSIKRHDARF